jgi:hypothetical protein
MAKTKPARIDMYGRIEERLNAMSAHYRVLIPEVVPVDQPRLRRYALETDILKEHLDRKSIIVNGNLPVTLTSDELVDIVHEDPEFKKLSAKAVKADVLVIGRHIQIEGISRYLLKGQKLRY